MFDSLNYIENMRLGIDAVGAAGNRDTFFLSNYFYFTPMLCIHVGGIIEAAVCYTGDVTQKDARYNLDYYVNFARFVSSPAQLSFIYMLDLYCLQAAGRSRCPCVGD